MKIVCRINFITDKTFALSNPTNLFKRKKPLPLRNSFTFNFFILQILPLHPHHLHIAQGNS